MYQNGIRGHLVFIISVCLGQKALTLSMKFERMAKRLRIWHVYSTNKTFQDDSKINDLDRDLYSIKIVLFVSQALFLAITFEQ